jgi:hypothetical protein
MNPEDRKSASVPNSGDKRFRKSAAASTEAVAQPAPIETARLASPETPHPEASLAAPTATPQRKEEDMNATSFALRLSHASFDEVSPLLTKTFDDAAKNLQALVDTFVAGLEGAEQVRAHVSVATTQALRDQLAAAAVFANVKTADEALQLQQQFARRALEFYSARAHSLGEVCSAAWQASAKPLTDRYAEISNGFVG